MTYDEAIRKAEQIVQSLEQAEALSVQDYQQRAKEVNQLLQFCEQELGQISHQLGQNA